jgi:hypothetical protein
MHEDTFGARAHCHPWKSEAAIRAEGSWTDSKAIHNINGAEACQQYKHKKIEGFFGRSAEAYASM